MSIDLREHAQASEYGLTTEPQRHLNRVLQDYDRHLSLRRIPERDPAFQPGQAEFGVWEETSAAATKWVFTFPEITITTPERVLARVASGDMSKLTPKQRLEKLQQAAMVTQLAERKAQEEKLMERLEEAQYIASTPKSSIRHKIDGEDRILSDEPGGRSPRTFIV